MAVSKEAYWQTIFKRRMAETNKRKPHKIKKGKLKEIIIVAPIEVIPSTNYYLVMKDANGRYHYFGKEGGYDGCSRDVSALNLK